MALVGGFALGFVPAPCSSPARCAYAAEVDRLEAFSGVPRNGYAAQSLGFVPQDEETFVEQWQLLAQLDDGGLVQVFFAVHNLGLGDLKPVLLVKYVSAQGEIHTAEDFPQAFTAQSDSLALRFGPSSLELTHSGYALDVAAGDLSLVMSIRSEAPSYTPGDGLIRIAGEKRASLWNIFLPRGRASGTLTVAGHRREFSAYVYGDHTQGTLLANAYSRLWVSTRIHTASYSVDFLTLYTTDEVAPDSAALVVVAGDDQILFASKHCRLDGDLLTEMGEVGVSTSQWRFACEDGSKAVKVDFDVHAVVHRSSAARMLRGLDKVGADLLVGKATGHTFSQRHRVDLLIDGRRTKFVGESYSEMLTFGRERR